MEVHVAGIVEINVCRFLSENGKLRDMLRNTWDNIKMGLRSVGV
jgi:hypothetical protein